MREFNSIEHKVIYEKLMMYRQNRSVLISEESQENTIFSKEENQNKIHQNSQEISEKIKIMENKRINSAHRHIMSHRKIMGSLVVFFKKVVRKSMKWYINPICDQQTEFNNAVVPSIGKLAETQGELLGLINYESEKINALEIRNTEYIEKINALEVKSTEYIGKTNELEKINKIISDKINQVELKLNKLDSLNLDIFKEEEFNLMNKRTLSQAGEDSILAFAINTLGMNFEDCVYLDLGANHAKEMSNTYFFYSMGARGVLVEANPELIPELKFFRNGDIILNKCVSDKSGELIEFYILNGDGLSTPNLEVAEECIRKNSNLEIIKKVTVETITVNEIIETYLGKSPVILNVDIEGKEMDILNSIDFDKYRPMFIIIEMIEYKPTLVVGEKNNEILRFMEKKSYQEYAFSGINSIFIDTRQI